MNDDEPEGLFDQLCDLVHIARKHDPEHPGGCLIRYPGAYRFCGGAESEARAIANALLDAGWRPTGGEA